MRIVRSFSKAVSNNNNNRRNRPTSLILSPISHFTPPCRSLCQIASTPKRPSFGIAFDIDGVILRGHTPIGNSPTALRRLYDDSGRLMIPYLFLTNGGGTPESRKASELSELLGVNVLPSQVVLGHSPFRSLLNRFENKPIVATGKGEPSVVMSEYGFKKVTSLEDYASYFDSIDPLSQYKIWTANQASNQHRTLTDPHFDVTTERVEAAFVVSDPVDWGRDIQVLCDILRSGGLPGKENGHQPHLYFAADDLEYQAVFPCERLGLGAFRIALESIFNSIHHSPLEYTSFGKPNPFVFKNAESILNQLLLSSCHGGLDVNHKAGIESHSLKTFYMIGDNPKVDIKGARQAGESWFSILTRTGVFKGKENHSVFPADQVVDTMEDAVKYVLDREGIA